MNRFKGLENKKILVVEDVELNQHLARHIMESWGCSVEIAANGAIALEKVAETVFDIVLMDIQMPIMDGIEATKNIRRLNDSEKASTPVIALTANLGKGECSMYREAGMNDCLAKPFEEAPLFEMVCLHLRKPVVSYATTTSETADAGLSDSTASAGRLYDLSMVESISGGDASFVKKMLQLFIDTVPATLRDIETACGSAEWMTLSKAAHKLKSTIDSMGIVSLKQDIRFIEINCKAGERLEEVPAKVSRVLSVMASVIDRVRQDHGL